MARKVRDKELDSREARAKLKPRAKPYYRSTGDRGLHLGYRRLKGQAGSWIARHYVGEQQYKVERIGTADDINDADGRVVLSYHQAHAKTRHWMLDREKAEAGITGPLTVADVMHSYLEQLESHRKSGGDARYRINAHILPTLGKVEVEALTTDTLRKWLNRLASSSPLTNAHTPRQTDGSEEAIRRRKSSANRVLAILRGALNHAFQDGKVPSDDAWRRVKPFKNVDTARVRFLTVAEAQRFVNACDPDFRPMAQAALLTGARYGELARLQVKDFKPDSGTLAIPVSKSGKSRHVVLTEEGVALFRRLCAGRPGNEVILRRANGDVYSKSNQALPTRLACAHAGISPPIGFHQLRHTYASLTIMAGAPLLVVAQNLGHANVRMIEKHYGHLTASYLASQIRAAVPAFGFEIGDKVVALP